MVDTRVIRGNNERAGEQEFLFPGTRGKEMEGTCAHEGERVARNAT